MITEKRWNFAMKYALAFCSVGARPVVVGTLVIPLLQPVGRADFLVHQLGVLAGGMFGIIFLLGALVELHIRHKAAASLVGAREARVMWHRPKLVLLAHFLPPRDVRVLAF